MLLLVLLGIPVAIGLSNVHLSRHEREALTPMALAAVAAMAVVVATAFYMRRLVVRRVDDIVHNLVSQHAEALTRRYLQLVTPDAYGSAQTSRWEKEVEYFLSTQVEPALASRRQRTILRNKEGEYADLISSRIAESAKASGGSLALRPNAMGAEFEAYCAERLRGTGWDAHVTKGSRDQGVDVVATKNGTRVVLQCKMYSRPVGNKAVQEAAAGRAFERAHYAVVVSSTAYTRDAEQLAQTTGVLLLHHSQLERLDALLADARPTASGAAS